MPRPRFERALPAKQDAILDAAAREFAEHGYESASVNRILLAAGFSKGLFYYYFDDKADLAVAVVERESVRYLKNLEVLKEPKSVRQFWAQVEKMVELHERLSDQAPKTTDALMRLGTAMARDPSLLQRMTSGSLARAMTRLSDYWKAGQEIGAVRKDLPLPLMLQLVSDVKVSLMRAMLPADRAPSREELKRFTEVHMETTRRIVSPSPT